MFSTEWGYPGCFRGLGTYGWMPCSSRPQPAGSGLELLPPGAELGEGVQIPCGPSSWGGGLTHIQDVQREHIGAG